MTVGLSIAGGFLLGVAFSVGVVVYFFGSLQVWGKA